ncbi:MAG: hypothetical protein PHS30_09125 [Bacteroidales bacterium]|nr:hypothetical protein [Bacteroidales bacterium]
METLTGKLEFISFFHIIKVGDKDLRDYLWKLFTDLNGVKASMKQTMNCIEIYADDESENHLKFERDHGNKSLLILLTKEPAWGFSNLAAFIPDMLQRLNGMQVIVTLTEHSIKIENDPGEKVFELKYTDGNSCRISDDKVMEICKPGTEDCCIFLTMGRGWSCEKFNSSMARLLLQRHAEGTMRASRIGNCKIVGRNDPSPEI